MINDLYKKEEFIKYKNNKTYENALNLVNYICENIENIDLKNINNITLCEFVTKYLFNVKIGKWDEVQTKFIIYYLSKKYSRYFNISDEVCINFLTEDDYKEKYADDSIATCVNHSNFKFDINFSPAVIKFLMSDNINEFLRGLSIVFHELTHVMQNMLIGKENKEYDYTKNIYLMTLETIIRKADKNFYSKNYLNLFKENQAEKIGLKNALEVIKTYNKKLYSMYDEEKLQKKIDKYDERLKLDYEVQVYNFNSTRVIEVMEYICSSEIKDHIEYLDKYPILKLAYNDDGTKKDIIQLYKERIRLLGKGADQTKIDSLYECIANSKLFVNDSCKKESEAIIDYIKEKGCNDKFLVNLLLFRLRKGLLSEEKINRIIELLGLNIDEEQTEMNKVY